MSCFFTNLDDPCDLTYLADFGPIEVRVENSCTSQDSLFDPPPGLLQRLGAVELFATVRELLRGKKAARKPPGYLRVTPVGCL